MADIQIFDKHNKAKKRLVLSEEAINSWFENNYGSQEEITNTIAMSGFGEYYDDLRFPAQAINPAGAVAAPTVDTTETGFPGTLLFSGTADQMIAFNAQIPHTWKVGSSIHPHIHWTKTTADAADNVTWELYYRFFNQGLAPDAWVGPITGLLVVDHNGTAEAEAITSFGEIDMTGRDISQNILFRLYRRGVTDAYNSNARLIEVDIHYLMDTNGSEEEFEKISTPQ